MQLRALYVLITKRARLGDDRNRNDIILLDLESDAGPQAISVPADRHDGLCVQQSHAQKYKLVEVGPLSDNEASTIAIVTHDYGQVGGVWITNAGEYRGFMNRPNASCGA